MNISDVLHDAVDGIEPTDRIDEIRARTASSAHSAARPWFLAAGGVVLATAATVAGFAILDSSPPQHDHGTMQMPTTQLVAAYFVGDTPSGPRLFREFDEVPAGDRLQAALDRIEQPAADPDYRTSWPEGSLGAATVEDGVILVEIDSARDPAGIAAQQIVYTLQGAVGQRLPVRFTRNGTPVGPAVDGQPQLDVLSPVSISDPAEGNSYSGGFTARGRAAGGTVLWHIGSPDGPRGGPVFAHGTTTARGAGDQLYEWRADVDLTGLSPGTYTFVATHLSFTDTRTITVR